MQKTQREHFILEKLNSDQKINTDQLVQDLQVSVDTIRRDLNEMGRKGLLTKVRGGAVSSIQKLYYYNENVIKNYKEKEVIAKKAVSLVKNGMSIIITDGTTNLAFARNLPKDLKATIFTYCLPIAMELMEHPEIEIIFLGGKIEKKGMVCIGLDVITKFSKINADFCFLGTGSINPKEGITAGLYEVSLIKKTIINSSAKVVSLAVSEKLGKVQKHDVCKLNKLFALVTELNPKNNLLLPYRNANIDIL